MREGAASTDPVFMGESGKGVEEYQVSPSKYQGPTIFLGSESHILSQLRF